jgi:hypothetical protein
MRYQDRSRSLLLVVALAMLSLRALTPEGYMPGSKDSGLLFELCPSGMPVAIMRALGGNHHHHHGDTTSVSGTEQCPIGHMLSTAVAVDSGLIVETPPVMLRPAPERASFPEPFRTIAYRSRAPPA